MSLLSLFYIPQSTFNAQFTQRYRNNRRESRKVTCPKLVVSQATVESSAIESSKQLQDVTNEEDEYEENVETLKKLMAGKNPPKPRSVIQLLDDTREKRRKWLEEEISIHQILEKYVCFKKSKWVSNTISFQCPSLIISYILFQLLHEFNCICKSDVVAMMENKWIKLCQYFQHEKLVLQKIERNVYHKCPRSLRPIIFSMVRAIDT